MRASSFACVVALVGVALTHTAAAASPAPDVEVFVEPTLRHAVEDVGALFRARTGAPVRFFSSPSVMLVGQIPFTLCDVVILQGEAVMDRAVAHKAADGSTRVPLGRNHLVLARRDGASGPARLLQDVKADGAVAVVDAPVPDALGALSHGALQTAGWPGPAARIIGVATGADAAYLLETGEAKLAVLYRTDVAADPALSVVANLPDGPAPITYAAALSQSVNSPNARAFLDFLTGPVGRERLRADGLDIAP